MTLPDYFLVEYLSMRSLLTAALLVTGCSGPPSVDDDYPDLPRETLGEVRACVDDNCVYETVESALDAATDGVTVRILPGTFRDGGVVRAHGVRIEAEGAYLFDATWEGKANLVVKGNDTLIEGLRCSHIRVADANGACIRAEGRNLTLRRVHFHDAQSGVLSGRDAGRIVIEDSVFERLGNRSGEVGNAHGLYIGSIEEFVLRGSRVVDSTGEGHEVKSRAASTLIENCVIASLSGRDSRQIDLPNGGDIVIRGNVLEKGPNSSHRHVIAIGMERGDGHGSDHDVNRALIENNTFVLDRSGPSWLVGVSGVPEPVRRNNVIVYDRASSGLAAFPFLPAKSLSLVSED
jgi:hypothetical protein